MSQTKILVVDDDANILFAFRQVIESENFISIEARDGREGLQKALSEKPDIVFMDIRLPHLNGLEALQKIREQEPSPAVIVITGQGNMQTAVKAMQLGAFEYLTKPLSIAKVRDSIHCVLKSTHTAAVKMIPLQAEECSRYEIIGDSAAMQRVYKLIGSISTTPNHTSVLITGESGTGKELVARAIHNNSSNADEPFVGINCNVLTETLLESELFGHEKGAFTGASERKLGKFEIAGTGTLFLDEIGDLSPKLQQKLLRVLQEREFERLGGNMPIKVNARFIAASNQNIVEKVKAGTFREDLYYRLNVVMIQLPPLRERIEDIGLLAEFFLRRYNQQLQKQIVGFSEEALQMLHNYDYPGNVRELENLIERAVMLCQGEVLLADFFSDTMITTNPFQNTSLPIVSSDFSAAREHILNLFEKQFVSKQLKKFRGNISAAARGCNMSRQNFHRLMLKHHIKSNPHAE